MSDRSDVLDRCLGWLRAHLDWFGPRRWNQQLPALEIPTQTVVELLLLCRVLARGPYVERTADLTAAARRLAREQITDPAFSDALGRADEEFPYLVWAMSLLGDDPDPDVAVRRRQAEQVLQTYSDALCPLIWPIWNHIELDYICGLGGFPTATGGFAALRGPAGYAWRDLMLIREPEAYGITHELFYATDFGGQPLPVPPEQVAEVRMVVRTLLATALVDGQLDLAAELIQCLLALDPGSTDPLLALGWRQMIEAQHPSGAVPGPPYVPELIDQAEGDKRTALIFRTCYHTTLVAAMAAAAANTRNDAPPIADGADPLLPGRIAVAVRERRLSEAAELALALPDEPDQYPIVRGVARQLIVNECSGDPARRLLEQVSLLR